MPSAGDIFFINKNEADITTKIICLEIHKNFTKEKYGNSAESANA